MRVALAAIALCVGCADPSPCDGLDGTCLGLLIDGPVGAIDQLGVAMTGSARLDARTPAQPGAPRPLPITTAIQLPNVSGHVDLRITGFNSGIAVGEAALGAEVAAGTHQTLTVNLSASIGGDLGGDLAGDLAGADLSVPSDLSAPRDLIRADLSGLNLRHVFVLPARSGNLGTLNGLDNDCSLAAQLAAIPGSGGYRAVIAYPTESATAHILLGAGRTIVLPDGTPVTTDSDFWSISHAGPINQLANGTPVTGCAFTNFGAPGTTLATGTDCGDWASTAASEVANTGDVSATDAHWAYLFPALDCSTAMCHVYCIEQ